MSTDDVKTIVAYLDDAQTVDDVWCIYQSEFLGADDPHGSLPIDMVQRIWYSGAHIMLDWVVGWPRDLRDDLDGWVHRLEAVKKELFVSAYLMHGLAGTVRDAEQMYARYLDEGLDDNRKHQH